MPRLSVILAVYNDATFLQKAVESIIAQTFIDFEFLIIDDGSTDDTAATLATLQKKDARIRVISIDHVGLTKALNVGIRESVGEYLARMDADDESHPKRFAKQVAFLDANKAVGLCGTRGTFLSVDGKVLGNKDLPTGGDIIKKKLLFNNQFIHSSWMLRRTVVEKLGAYNETFSKSQDYEFALRIARVYDVANTPDRLIAWRVRDASLSWSSKAQEWHAIRARWYAITQHGYSFVSGLFHVALRLGWLCVPQRLKMKRYAP